MQGTVARFDEETHQGTVLLDDGSELAFGAGAFAASGLRLLRLGQRMTIGRDDHGEVISITFPGLS